MQKKDVKGKNQIKRKKSTQINRTTKNKRNNTDRLEITKYCPFCKKRTTHKETK